VSAPELRERGNVLVQRVGEEMSLLDRSLADLLPAGEQAREVRVQ
jgi:hypothetical protein